MLHRDTPALGGRTDPSIPWLCPSGKAGRGLAVPSGIFHVHAPAPSTDLPVGHWPPASLQVWCFQRNLPRSPFCLKGVICTHHCLCRDIPKEHHAQRNVSFTLSPFSHQIITKPSNKEVSARTVLSIGHGNSSLPWHYLAPILVWCVREFPAFGYQN